MVGIAQGVNGQGLNLANLDETTQDEIDAYLTTRWRGRGPLYDQYAMSLMLDYAPDFAKLHWLAAECFRTMPSDPETYDPSFATPNSVQQLHSYMVLGWEMGIRNQFRVLRRLGFTRAQIMEIVMFGRLTAGMRGLGHVYHAIGDVLPDYADGHGNPDLAGGLGRRPGRLRLRPRPEHARPDRPGSDEPDRLVRAHDRLRAELGRLRHPLRPAGPEGRIGRCGSGRSRRCPSRSCRT